VGILMGGGTGYSLNKRKIAGHPTNGKNTNSGRCTGWARKKKEVGKTRLRHSVNLFEKTSEKGVSEPSKKFLPKTRILNNFPKEPNPRNSRWGNHQNTQKKPTRLPSHKKDPQVQTKGKMPVTVKKGASKKKNRQYSTMPSLPIQNESNQNLL